MKKYFIILGIFICVSVCCILIGLTIFAINKINELENEDVTSKDECIYPNETADSSKLFDQVIRYHHCMQMPFEPFNLILADETTLFGYISTDYTNLNYGKLVVTDTNQIGYLVDYDFKSRTLLKVVEDKVLNERYYFMMVSSQTGTTCPITINDPDYDFLCGKLEQDLKNIGGIWLYDTETKQLQRLFSLNI